MQQRCNTCGRPIQPGSPACTTCGAPVTSAGAGSYDQTIRASAPPGSAYGSQPYGAPPSSYGALPSSPSGTPPPRPGYGGPPPAGPYGAPPAQGFGVPPPGFGAPQPGFGAPPAQQGFGTSPAYSPPPGFGTTQQGPFYGAPQPGFGGPPFAPAAPPPQKSRALWYVLGSGALAVIIIVAIILFVGKGNNNATANTSATPTASSSAPTTAPTAPLPQGQDITNVEIGIGDGNGHLIQQTTRFTTSDNLVVAFTVTTHSTHEEVELRITEQSSGQEVYHDSLTPPAGRSNQSFPPVQPGSTGTFTLELQFNGATEYMTTITVTS